MTGKGQPLGEYMDKLRKLAEGALRSIDRHDEEEPKADHSRQRAWWQGYRQCIDDVEDFNRKHPIATREDTA